MLALSASGLALVVTLANAGLNKRQHRHKRSDAKVAPEHAVAAETSLLHGGGAISYRRSGDGQLGTSLQLMRR